MYAVGILLDAAVPTKDTCTESVEGGFVGEARLASGSRVAATSEGSWSLS